MAERLRSALQASYTDAGYEKLSEPVNELVESGQIARNGRVKHLELAAPSFELEAATTNANSARGAYVREDAWPVFAMLHERSTGRQWNNVAYSTNLMTHQVSITTPCP